MAGTGPGTPLVRASPAISRTDMISSQLGQFPVLDHHGDGAAQGLTLPKPERKRTWSRSIFMRPPRPLPLWRRLSSLSMNSKSTVKWAGYPPRGLSAPGRATRPLYGSSAWVEYSVVNRAVTPFSDRNCVRCFSAKATVKEVQDVSLLAAKAFGSIFRRPHYVRDILIQMELIGVGSLPGHATGFLPALSLPLQTSKTPPRLVPSVTPGALVPFRW